MTEGGVDLTLDRNRMSSSEDHLKNRGDRWSPWLDPFVPVRYGVAPEQSVNTIVEHLKAAGKTS